MSTNTQHSDGGNRFIHTPLPNTTSSTTPHSAHTSKTYITCACTPTFCTRSRSPTDHQTTRRHERTPATDTGTAKLRKIASAGNMFHFYRYNQVINWRSLAQWYIVCNLYVACKLQAAVECIADSE
ncbi:hypothetical protein BaRGS_00002585 [Batillaria attramentaria]|uniref:Uncharacterized protein n=1 Tax=Batillaria attramentaria TaxID=370345 RepID=A0ABD0M4Y9_9CAEN